MEPSTAEKTPLAEAFERSGLSQAELARRLRASESQVSRWLRNVNEPGDRFWKPRIARCLKSTVEELWP